MYVAACRNYVLQIPITLHEQILSHQCTTEAPNSVKIITIETD